MAGSAEDVTATAVSRDLDAMVEMDSRNLSGNVLSFSSFDPEGILA